MVTAQLCVTEDEPIRADIIDGVSGEFIVLQIGGLTVFTVNKGSTTRDGRGTSPRR
jgi:hypothetical protein